MKEQEKKGISKEIREIVENTIEKNRWDKLSSIEYNEFTNVTDIGKNVIFEGKHITGAEVTDILEKLEICKRDNKVIKLTKKGEKYGRYVITIHISDNKPIITDIGYLKYKKQIIDIIQEFIKDNPEFLKEKREERKQKSKETKRKNKELKENKEEKENGTK